MKSHQCALPKDYHETDQKGKIDTHHTDKLKSRSKIKTIETGEVETLPKENHLDARNTDQAKDQDLEAQKKRADIKKEELVEAEMIQENPSMTEETEEVVINRDPSTRKEIWEKEAAVMREERLISHPEERE